MIIISGMLPERFEGMPSGAIMLEVTDRAAKVVADYFKDKRKRPIRIFVRLGGCGIRTFGVALEEPKASDRVFEINGQTYIINDRLLKLVQPIKFDSDGIGFRLSGSGVAPPHGCGNCGNMCGVRGGTRCPGDCATCELQCGHGRRLKTAGSSRPQKEESWTKGQNKTSKKNMSM